MNRARMRLKSALLQVPYRLRDRRLNRCCTQDQPRILILRHGGKYPYFRESMLDWMAAELPQIRRLFELRLLPCPVADWSDYCVCAPWLQDPAEDWMPRGAWRRLQQIQHECDVRQIPVLNRAECLSHAVKSVASRRITATGVRTPRVEEIHDPEQFLRDQRGMPFPMIIREDRRHAAETFVVHNVAQLRQVPWQRFTKPVAAEFIDVRDPRDGGFRKYRYIVAGEFGVPRHLIVSSTWEVRAAQRVRNQNTREEELAYLEQPEPNHALFQRVRKSLHLDLIAFDYSYDGQGRLVIWEANPYPGLHYASGPDVEYTRPFVERSFAAVTAMHLAAARMEIPARIGQMLHSCQPPSSTQPDAAGPRSARSTDRLAV